MSFRLQILRGQPVQDWKERLVDMWLGEGVIAREEAERRVREVVCALLDDNDRVLGVTTAYPGRIGRFPDPVWFVRMFVRREARGHQGLAVKGALQWKALETTFRALEETSPAPPFRGAVLVTENRKFWSERWLRAFSARGWKPMARDKDGKYIHFRPFRPSGAPPPSETTSTLTG